MTTTRPEPTSTHDEPADPSTGVGGLAAAPDGSSPLVRLRLDLGYDGTAFAGWAAQRGGLRTVQGELEAALGTVTRLSPAPRLTVAGRTDSGVHARGQVAHVDLPSEVWAAMGGSLVRRLRGVLPADVRVTRAQLAPAGFDARFSPLWRRYAYRICDAPEGPEPLRRAEVLAYPRRLDVDAMAAAAAALVGERDFAAFCKRREGASTVRRLLHFGWSRQDDGVVVADVVADAFCHSMVRALVGASVAVGEGRRPTRWPLEVLLGRARDPGVMVARAHGLTLEEVRYPEAQLLASRADETRRHRGQPSEPSEPLA